VHDLLQSLALILLAGLVAAPLASLLRVPVMIVLLALGVALGPFATDLVDWPAGRTGAQLVFTLGVSFILFYGGLRIDAAVISRTAIGIAALALPGIFITSLVVAAFAMPLFDMSFGVALLLGAVLSATDPAILIPLFDRLRLRPKVAQTVIAESAFNDPTATILALSVAGVVGASGGSFAASAVEFVQGLVIGCVAGTVAGAVLVGLTSSRWSGLWRESPAAALLGVIALMYFTTDRVGGSAYLGAFVMGLVVGNARRRDSAVAEHRRLLETFASEVAEIATIAVFVTLGINLPLDQVREHFLPAVAIVCVLMFAARPLTVAVCLGLDRRGAWTWREAAFVTWCRETGVVPAALASLLLARQVDGAETISAVVAMAVCVTLLVQATTAGAVARRLDLT
jgi:cell volume regulation protein A